MSFYLCVVRENFTNGNYCFSKLKLNSKQISKYTVEKEIDLMSDSTRKWRSFTELQKKFDQPTKRFYEYF